MAKLEAEEVTGRTDWRTVSHALLTNLVRVQGARGAAFVGPNGERLVEHDERLASFPTVHRSKLVEGIAISDLLADGTVLGLALVEPGVVLMVHFDRHHFSREYAAAAVQAVPYTL